MRVEVTEAPDRVLAGSKRRNSVNYFWLLGNVLTLLGLGVVMVVSASTASESGAFRALITQGLYALIGLVLMFLVARLNQGQLMRLSNLILIVGVVMQLAVFIPHLGVEHGGNVNWLKLGPVSFQPSEFLKLGLAIWLGAALVRKRSVFERASQNIFPLFIASSLVIGLVMLGNDLGTAMIMILLFFGAVIFGRIPAKHLLLPAGLGLGIVLFLAVISPNRMDRIMNFFHLDCTRVNADYLNQCWQPIQSTWALANGNLTGVGIGNSVSKWNWLPAADSDYIFAIIGEELGLVGTVLVLLLVLSLAIVFLRIIRGSDDVFVCSVTGAIMFWTIGQALINIAVVLHLLPVLGVPLPFVSAGGTALISSLTSVGVVLSFIRSRKTQSLEFES